MADSTIPILFIEDEMNMRFFLKTLLETNGFQPIMARNGNEGISLARKEHPRVILLDVMMPEKGGTLTYVTLKSDRQLGRIPVIILSGVEKRTFYHYLDMQNVSRTDKIPEPAAYVQKPPEPLHLVAVIRDVLAERAS